jgi:hypothetical protein
MAQIDLILLRESARILARLIIARGFYDQCE